MAPALVPLTASMAMRPSSRSRSSTPQVKAPCEPPPCRARLMSLVNGLPLDEWRLMGQREPIIASGKSAGQCAAGLAALHSNASQPPQQGQARQPQQPGGASAGTGRGWGRRRFHKQGGMPCYAFVVGLLPRPRAKVAVGGEYMASGLGVMEAVYGSQPGPGLVEGAKGASFVVPVRVIAEPGLFDRVQRVKAVAVTGYIADNRAD